MDIEHAADALWAGIRRGEHMPGAWRGRLSMADAYRVNLAILRRRVAEVMGGPEHSVAWLANKLAEFDLFLEAGMRVMSGSFARQYNVARGDKVVAAFEPFGTVRARLD
jgi:2-keto-4-pentenoate hydratase